MRKRLPKRAIIVPVLCLLFLAFAPSALAQEDALYLGGGEFDNMHHLLELSDGNIILSLSTYIREDYTEDEVYRSGKLCLIGGEAWACLNVDKDNRSFIELRRVILPE